MPTNPMPRLAEQTPATTHEAQAIRNGVYEITVGMSSFSFRISTITQARTEALIGKRVVSRMRADGTWQMFAFVTQAGTLKLWQRFAEQEGLPYVVMARTLLDSLATYVAGDYGVRPSGSFRRLERDIEISFTTICRVCNGRVTGATTALCSRHSRSQSVRSSSLNETVDPFGNTVSATSSVSFSSVGEVVYADSSGPVVVPQAIIERLAKSEINPRNIQ